jgi:hypothetical protein
MEVIMTKLKPCPFCGEIPDSRIESDVEVVCCITAYCPADQTTLIDDWNDRPIEDAQSKLINNLGETLIYLLRKNVSNNYVYGFIDKVKPALTAYNEWKEAK